jgi:hypothetical protein
LAVILRASVRPTECNLARDVALSGLIDRRIEPFRDTPDVTTSGLTTAALHNFTDPYFTRSGWASTGHQPPLHPAERHFIRIIP